MQQYEHDVKKCWWYSSEMTLEQAAYNLCTHSSYSRGLLLEALRKMVPGRRGGVRKYRVDCGHQTVWVEVRKRYGTDDIEYEARARYKKDPKKQRTWEQVEREIRVKEQLYGPH